MKMPRPSKARTLLLALLLSCLAMAPQAWAGPEEFVLDPVHTRVLFTVEHAGFSSALGTISGSTGGLVFDPEDWSSARVDVSVPLQRLDLGDTKWNRATLARNLLDAERFPDARFVSTRVEPLGGNRANVIGMLTLRGVSREVKLDVVFNTLRRHPLPPFRLTAGFSATATISRSDFGISAWKSMIGDEIGLRMEVEAVRGRFTDATGDLPPETAPAAGDETVEDVNADPVPPDLDPDPVPEPEPETVP